VLNRIWGETKLNAVWDFSLGGKTLALHRAKNHKQVKNAEGQLQKGKVVTVS